MVGPGVFDPLVELFAQRVSVREELAGQVLVYDRHTGRAGPIAIGKGAAGDQRDAHCGKVLRANGARRVRLRLAIGAAKVKVQEKY